MGEKELAKYFDDETRPDIEADKTSIEESEDYFSDRWDKFKSQF